MEGANRRTWNRQEFQLIAQKRLTDLSPSIKSTAPDFYCALCKSGFSDQAAYLDHINSWKHRERKSHDPKAHLPQQPTVQGVRSLLAELCAPKAPPPPPPTKKPKATLNPQLQEMKLAGFLQDNRK